ncbi:hypothetical protein [Nocardioides sp.]|uniref:hypothetical protein n=1 Tax=Nocardioides sp. TaxID=35761 RepID=UPI0035296A5C
MSEVTARRSAGGRLLLLGVVDVLVAGVAAMAAFHWFGAVSGDDTNPPTCYNGAGHTVSCALTQPVVMLPTFIVVLLGLVAVQLARGRRGR